MSTTGVAIQLISMGETGACLMSCRGVIKRSPSPVSECYRPETRAIENGGRPLDRRAGFIPDIEKFVAPVVVCCRMMIPVFSPPDQHRPHFQGCSVLLGSLVGPLLLVIAAPLVVQWFMGHRQGQ